MGYSTCNGRLCCDLCGKAEGTTRRRRCPAANYCPPTPLCPECSREVRRSGQWKEWHKSCPTAAAEFEARQQREQQMREAGQFVRFSALSTRDRQAVHVLFQNGQREVHGYYMSHAAYRSVPIGEPATPDTYRKLGAVLTPAPSDFYDENKGAA